jgi:EmrB/QacA subfamily drug resistance transporter
MKNGREADRKQARPSRKAFAWVVVSVMFAAFMSKLDIYIVNISLPVIADGFHTSVSVVSRMIIVYLLAGTSTLLFFGRMGDRFGQKKIFILGYAVFTVGSFLCSLATGIHLLVFFRFLQGLGGAMILSSAYAIVPKLIPQEINGWAFGIISTGAAVGIAIGAPLGGLILRVLSWHWIFLINVPVGVLAIVVAWVKIPSDAKEEEPCNGIGQYDLPGTFLSFAGLSCLLYAINIGEPEGWLSLKVILLFGLSAVTLVSFYLWERKTQTPLFDFGIYRDTRFLYVNIAAFFGIALLGGSSFTMPFYLEISRDLNPFAAGLVLMSYSVVYIFVSPLTGKASDTIQPPLLCAIGMASSAVAVFVFAGTLSFPGLAPGLIYLTWLGISFGFFFSPNNNYVMSLPAPGKKGVASGSYNAVVTIGTALGVAVFETVFSMSLPAHQGELGDHLAMNPGYGEILERAFRNTFLAGGCLCVLSAIFSAVNVRRKGRRAGLL